MNKVISEEIYNTLNIYGTPRSVASDIETLELKLKNAFVQEVSWIKKTLHLGKTKDQLIGLYRRVKKKY